MNTRWFQFGTFTPLLRAHGEYPYREMWKFGGETSPAYQAQLKFDRLRYRLLPYIYSLAGAVTQEGGTIMRALVMDFRADAKAREIGDEYMFGPALLVSPVTEAKARTRPVYLPEAAGWYDFWTGAAVAGGQTIEAPAPYDAIPLFVRAGAHRAVRPRTCSTPAEKPADPITLFVYAGCRRGVHALRGRRTDLWLRAGRLCAHSDPLERCDAHADDRPARGFVPGHARRADISNRGGLKGPAGRLLVCAGH